MTIPHSERAMPIADRRRMPICFWCLATLTGLALLGAAGCDQASPVARSDGPATPAASADVIVDVAPDELLKQVATAYRQATTYQDAGQLQFTFELADKRVDERSPMSVTFERPDKLLMHCYDAFYLCDGAVTRGTFGALNRQMLAGTAPGELSLESIFQNQILARALGADGGMIAGIAPQLQLLLSDNFLAELLKDAAPPQFIPSRTIDDAPCQGIAIDRPDGRLILWIDPQTLVIRRLELPVAELSKQLAPDGRIANLSLAIDFVGAKRNGSIAAVAFQFELPEGAELVENFDLRPLVPAPQPLSPLLGQKLPTFRFATLDGESIASESFHGQVAVLDFWATWCEPCLQSLPHLQQVYDKYKNDDRVRFYAITSDAADVTNETLEQTLTSRGVDIPILRDPQLAARDVFRVEGIPNTIVLGPDGTVEVTQLGADPAFADELAGYIERLLASESVVEQIRARHAQRVADYEAQMAAPVEGQQEAAPIEVTKTAPASEPLVLQKEALWTASGLRFPGNCLVVPVSPSADSRLFVLDGTQTVVEIGADGQIVARHELALPDKSDVTYLRTAVDRQGVRYFAGSAPAQQQCHIFDDAWQTRLSFPREGDHAGISDIQLADLEADGQLELVLGYWGDVGVQSVALDGQRQWSNRSMSDVFALALSGPDAGGRRLLLCANRRGTLVPIDALGNVGEDILLPGRYFRLITSADLDGDGQMEYCGISIAQDQSEQAVGLNAAAQEVWAVPIPKGAQPQPIEMIQAGDLLGEGRSQWIIAAPDGSLHIIAADGTRIDQFNYGAPLTGLAVATLDGQPALVVASRQAGEGRLEASRLRRQSAQ